MRGTQKASLAALSLGALGVVFGDIGTSPLYAFEAAVAGLGGTERNQVLGVASLILWTLLLIVSGKYIFLVMRADFHGEGGVFALLALLRSKLRFGRGERLPWMVILLLAGAALLIGDGTITPAISVLSAMEGLVAIDPAFEKAVVPATVGILLALFFVQRLGTGNLGKAFGFIMLVWFLTLGAMGLVWIARVPEVLTALNPWVALRMMIHAGPVTFLVLGAVVLTVTGVEALYADMGHFSRASIAWAWHGLALPALALNYLGQAALAISQPSAFAGGTPFFEMVPAGAPRVGLVVLATMATVIASQALISGVFSLTVQAQELGFMPRIHVVHTSRHKRAQVYVPGVNWGLAFLCILLVVTFRSSANLAAAYGLAVVGSMVITTIAWAMVAKARWEWSVGQAWGMAAFFLGVEILFLASCLTKFFQGAYFPLLVGVGFVVIMVTWWRGRAIIMAHMRAGEASLESLLERRKSERLSPGQMVLVTSAEKPVFAAARALELLRRGDTLREELIVLSMISSMESDVEMEQGVRVTELGPGVWHVVAQHGFMQEPHAPEIMETAREHSGGKIGPENEQTFYILPRELIVEYTGTRMPRWQRALFGVMNRNVSFAPDYFYIPTDQIVEFTWMIRA